MAKINVIVLRTAGTNCDLETAFAFETLSAKVDRVHINDIIAKKKSLSDYQILAIPGGFTYGDDIASGKILANEIKYRLGHQLEKFVADGKIIIGICNGFQVLVKAGILPNIDGTSKKIDATLSLNDSAKFEDRWIYLKNQNSKCIWTEGVDDVIYLPVAHAEGKFIPRNDTVLEQLKKNKQIVFTYCNVDGEKPEYPWNPNGSILDIAGICDRTGRVFGLMPHPERYMQPTQHPCWTRLTKRSEPSGLKIFRNGLEFVQHI